MKNNIDGILPLLAALIVLLTNVWSAETSFLISLGALMLLSLYHFMKRGKKTDVEPGIHDE